MRRKKLAVSGNEVGPGGGRKKKIWACARVVNSWPTNASNKTCVTCLHCVIFFIVLGDHLNIAETYCRPSLSVQNFRVHVSLVSLAPAREMSEEMNRELKSGVVHFEVLVCSWKFLGSLFRVWNGVWLGVRLVQWSTSSPPTTATRVRSWVGTWAVIGWSQSDSEGFSSGLPVFFPQQKSTFTPSRIVERMDHAPLAREIGNHS